MAHTLKMLTRLCTRSYFLNTAFLRHGSSLSKDISHQTVPAQSGQPPDYLYQDLKNAMNPQKVLDLVGTYYKIMNSKQLMQALRTLFTLQKYGTFLDNRSNFFSSPEFIMPRSRKNGRNTRRTPTTAIKSNKKRHCNPDDTAELTAGTTSHGEVVGVDGTAATSGNKKHCSKPKINCSSARFSEIKKTDHFVDKTKLIKVLFSDSRYVLITRPRRSGKSTNMNMVKEFVGKKVYTTGDKVGQEILRSPENDRAFPEMNLLLFQDEKLEISKWDKFSEYNGKYPTIYIDLQGINANNYVEILHSFRQAITEAFELHSYLLDCEDLWLSEKHRARFDKKEFEEYLYPPSLTTMIADSSKEVSVETILSTYIKNALPFLAEVLHKHFKHKIYLFIDEYDAPINDTLFENKDLCEKVNDLLTIFFQNLLKREDSFIARALITGISYMGSVGLSGVNNVKKHMFLRGAMGGDDRYEEFYGVTEKELEQLTTKFTEKFWQGKNKLPKEEVESYYKGYKSIGNSQVKIYSIWSIVNALKNGKLGNYWEKSGIMAGAKQGLHIPIVRIAIEHLLAGRSIKCEIPYKLELKHLQDLSDVILKWEEKRTLLRPDVLLSFLMQQGYLMYEKEIDEDIFEVKIPNTLLKNEFSIMMKECFEHDYDELIANVTAVFDEFSDNLSDDIMKRLIPCMEEVFEYVSEKWHQANEDAYHSVIFHCLCKSSKLKICTELSGKQGRLEIAFMFESKAIIIEVKHRETALTAYEEIISKKYANILRESLSNKSLECVCIGLNVDENNKVSIVYGDADNPGSPRQIEMTEM